MKDKPIPEEIDDLRAMWKAACMHAEDYEQTLIEIAEFGSHVDRNGVLARKALARHGIDAKRLLSKPPERS